MVLRKNKVYRKVIISSFNYYKDSAQGGGRPGQPGGRDDGGDDGGGEEQEGVEQLKLVHLLFRLKCKYSR